MAEPHWRERKKAQTRQRLQEQASRLFIERGYDATTVEQIAAAAGVSHMTFFRYFPTKEDAVLSDSYDPLLVAAIQARPRSEHPVVRIHAAVREGLGAIYAADREALLVRVRLTLRTPALRARLWENQVATRELLAGALVDGEPDFATRILASACLATLTSALEEWVATDGSAELPHLIDDAFAVLREGWRP
ncbi:TetR family transcriptional regulator [Actinophytocola algeriensis]|uniref:AcrR family transcriptional regulator n=1 Tax=Actinophytocola algeriensis TaxID=1768010 RepID=A0A7W7VIM4_9PSEU|nr:TetR family transcriptional regulator [Actinophytocola algeriensis]MBB4911608.1 AcrR family transcriptional regulator [Actinophytocola algeriensis]MBE1473404.1 AcrR family transcriptional regulator [Actinophytocola algeriensis]